MTHGVVGKAWQGMELSITQGNTSITEAGGLPLTMTSPNSPGSLTYMSEDFCLPYGNWTVKMNVNTTLNPLVKEDFFTSNESTRQYAPMWWEKVTYPPLLSVGETHFGLNVINGTLHGPDGPLSPFRLSWGIFPAAMREEAEAARTALDGGFGLCLTSFSTGPKTTAGSRPWPSVTWACLSTTCRLSAGWPWRSRCKLSLLPTRCARSLL